MMWLPLALLSRFLFAGNNVLGSHYRTYFPAGYSQQFFLSLYGIITVPLVFLLVQPVIPDKQTWLWLGLSGFLTSVYVIPYFLALRVADTSIVASLYAFSRILTPFIAYVMIGEKLSAHEWIGLLITIPGGLLATYDRRLTKKFNFKALWLMLLSSAGLSLLMSVSKLAYQHISGVDGFCYIYLFSTITSLAFFLVPNWRPVILENFKNIRPIIWSYALQPIVSIFANLTLFVALSLTKASYVSVIGQFSPFFVLIIIATLRNKIRLNAQEDFGRNIVLKKIAAFLIMSLGVAIMLLERAP